MVGLPDASVRESRDRVRSAIRNSGFEFPPHRITVNLAPADVRKAGASFDLPIALGILAASGRRRAAADRRPACCSASCRSTARFSRRAACCRLPPRRGATAWPGILLPAANAERGRDRRRASTSSPCRRSPTPCSALNDPAASRCAASRRRRLPRRPTAPTAPDLADVRGQLLARRALEIAAAGGHNLLLVGPPGAGKTMMARRVAGILPPLTFDEALEVTAVHSVAGLLPPGGGLLTDRPFRAPHHTISNAALVGGGSQPRPGEVSLAHHGVLFLDEMLEFSRHVLEVLRQPLEEGRVTVARAARTAVFPARFVLVGAMNPCPCGFAGDPTRECRCTPQQIARYRESAVGAAARSPGSDRRGAGAAARRRSSAGDAAASRRRRCARASSPRASGRRRGTRRDGIATNAELTPALMATHCAHGSRRRCGVLRAGVRRWRSARAATTACARSRARSPISPATSESAPITSPRRCSFGCPSSPFCKSGTMAATCLRLQIRLQFRFRRSPP